MRNKSIRVMANVPNDDGLMLFFIERIRKYDPLIEINTWKSKLTKCCNAIMALTYSIKVMNGNKYNNGHLLGGLVSLPQLSESQVYQWKVFARLR